MKSLLCITLLITAIAQQASAGECAFLRCQPAEKCDIKTDKFVSKFPSDLRVVSVSSGFSFGDIVGMSRREHCKDVKLPLEYVSLDDVYLYGVLMISGKLLATGTIRYEPYEGGEVDFIPEKKTFNNVGKFFEENFNIIHLPPLEHLSLKIKIPSKFAAADCWEARATVRFSGFEVVIGHTSASGVSPQDFKIEKILNFRKCSRVKVSRVKS